MTALATFGEIRRIRAISGPSFLVAHDSATGFPLSPQTVGRTVSVIRASRAASAWKPFCDTSQGKGTDSLLQTLKEINALVANDATDQNTISLNKS